MVLGAVYIVYYLVTFDAPYRVIVGLAFLVLGQVWHLAVRRQRADR
jgi:hypothetical protein